jgi:steroid delta-isomerase-like uncharacterized protein
MAREETLDRPAEGAPELGELFERWDRAWNSQDPEGIAAACTDDVVWHDPAMPEPPATGRAAVKEFAEYTFRVFPDFHVETVGEPYIGDGGTRIAQPWRITGTFLGSAEPPGFAPTGRSVDVRGVDLYEIRDGLLSRIDTVYDLMEWSRQMGLFPGRGSRSERTLALVQRAGARLRRSP